MSEDVPRPYGLLLELTYQCPLHCAYCSNPVQMSAAGSELTALEWQRVMEEAARLGVLHVHFSGGEPLLRKDLSELVACARAQGMYTNLITSALGLTRKRLQGLQEAGLDSIQISFQAEQAEVADTLAGTRAHARKLVAVALVRDAHLPLTVNIVLHRQNIDRLEALIALAEHLQAQRLELAHTQYLGWAFLNRAALLPTRAQLAQAEKIALAAQRRLRGKMELLYVLPDYYSERPKPCMHGWGQRFLTVNPLGDVLPCHAAMVIPDIQAANVRQHSLGWIWRSSPAFQRFRGSAWMPEPCQSCALREIDFGGCRCQAFLLTGDATRTDPVCGLAPDHPRLQQMLAQLHAGEHDVPLPVHLRHNP